jgi:gluconolactonase
VYRYDPQTKNIEIIGEGFNMPNGICFSDDEEYLYITDTGFFDGVSNTY